MSAKQILQYVTNKASEEQAAKILREADVSLNLGVGWVGFNEEGQAVNGEGQVVTFGAGSITGFSVGPPPAGSQRLGVGPQEAGAGAGAGVGGAGREQEEGVGVKGDPKRELSELHSGKTLTTHTGGPRGVSSTGKPGEQVSAEAAQKHAAASDGAVPNKPPEKGVTTPRTAAEGEQKKGPESGKAPPAGQPGGAGAKP